MALTDNCDIFGSLHEQGINRFVEHVQQQRPSLFNYATAQIAGAPSLLCHVVKAHPIVGKRNNPLVTIVQPLPIPGTNFGVNFAVQIAKLAVDFHPSGAIPLPAELSPLPAQGFALQLRVCAGFGCPPKEIVDKFIPPPEPPPDKRKEREDRRPPPPVVPLPTRELICFCLDVFASGGVRIRQYGGKPYLEPFLTGLEIVDIKPEGLENSLECYIQLLLKLSVLPKLRLLLEKAVLELMKDVLTVSVEPAPVSGAIPNNPAIEQDQLKVFIKLEVI